MSETNEKKAGLEVVILDFPITFGNGVNAREVTELQIARRLKAKDLKGVPAEDISFGHMIKLIAKMVGEPASLIEELDTKDLMKFVEIINSFL